MTNKLVVKKIELSKNKKSWEKFCKHCSNATFLQSYYWINFLEKYFKKSKPNHYAIFRSKEIVGVLPSFVEDNKIVSLPYTGAGGLNSSQEICLL